MARQFRSQPAFDEVAILLCGSKKTETADDEGVLPDAEAFPQGAVVCGPGVFALKERDDPPLPRIRFPVPCFGELPGIARVRNDAEGLLHDRGADGIAHHGLVGAVIVLGADGVIPVRVEQFAREGGGNACEGFPGQMGAGKEKVMEDDHARKTAEEVEHVDVELGIAEMVEDAVEIAEMFLKPAHRTEGKADVFPQGRLVVKDHAGHVVVLFQFRHKFGTVEGDAGLLRQKGGNVGQLQAFLGPSGHGFLQCPESLLCRLVPREGLHPPRAVADEASAERLVGQRAQQLVHQRARILRFKERLVAIHDFGQGRRGRGNGRSAAGHRLQQGQAEALVEGGENEKMAGPVQRLKIGIRHRPEQARLMFLQAPVFGMAAQGGFFPGIGHSRDDQLIAFAQGRRQEGKGGEEPFGVLAPVASDAEDKGLGDGVAAAYPPDGTFVERGRRSGEVGISGGGEGDDAVGAGVHATAVIFRGAAGWGEDDVGLFEHVQPPGVADVVLIVSEVIVLVETGDGVVEDGGYRRIGVGAHGEDGVALEKPGDEQDVRFQGPYEVFVEQPVQRLVFSVGAAAVPYLESRTVDAAVKAVADVVERVAEMAVGREQHLMVAPVVDDMFGESHGIAAHAAQAARSLASLEVYDDAHLFSPILHECLELQKQGFLIGRVEVFREGRPFARRGFGLGRVLGGLRDLMVGPTYPVGKARKTLQKALHPAIEGGMPFRRVDGEFDRALRVQAAIRGEAGEKGAALLVAWGVEGRLSHELVQEVAETHVAVHAAHEIAFQGRAEAARRTVEEDGRHPHHGLEAVLHFFHSIQLPGTGPARRAPCLRIGAVAPGKALCLCGGGFTPPASSAASP